MKDRRQADQNHEQFEKICQSAIINKLIDGPKTNRADDNDNQIPD
jgi:hypothetical protein